VAQKTLNRPDIPVKMGARACESKKFWPIFNKFVEIEPKNQLNLGQNPYKHGPFGVFQKRSRMDLTSSLSQRNVLPVAQSLEESAEITGSRATNPKPGQKASCRLLSLCLRLKTFPENWLACQV
jgi:hypothetical protein